MKTLQAIVALGFSVALMAGCAGDPNHPTAEDASPAKTSTADRTSADGTGHYALVNGIDLYYQVHGAGKPIILVHGGFQTADAWAAVTPELAKTRQVVAVDLQAHGHTADIDRPMRYDSMADDVAALIQHFGFDKADVMGYSVGGGVAVQLASRHPDLVDKAVVASFPAKSDGWFPEVQAGMAGITTEIMTATPFYEEYTRIAPRPQDWPVLVTKLKEMLTASTYDWTDTIASITTPTMIVVGDADSVRLPAAVEMFGLLGGGKSDGAMGGLPKNRLTVLPGVTHMDVVTRTDVLIPALTQFLDEQSD